MKATREGDEAGEDAPVVSRRSSGSSKHDVGKCAAALALACSASLTSVSPPCSPSSSSFPSFVSSSPSVLEENRTVDEGNARKTAEDAASWAAAASENGVPGPPRCPQGQAGSGDERRGEGEGERRGEESEGGSGEERVSISRRSPRGDVPATTRTSEEGEQGDLSTARSRMREETWPTSSASPNDGIDRQDKAEIASSSGVPDSNIQASSPPISSTGFTPFSLPRLQAEPNRRGSPEGRRERDAKAAASDSLPAEFESGPARGEFAADSGRTAKESGALDPPGGRAIARNACGEENGEGVRPAPKTSTEAHQAEGGRAASGLGECSVRFAVPLEPTEEGEASKRGGASAPLEVGLTEGEEIRNAGDSQVPQSEDDSEKDDEADEDSGTGVSPLWTEQDREGIAAILRASPGETQAETTHRLSFLTRLWQYGSASDLLSFSDAAAAARAARCPVHAGERTADPYSPLGGQELLGTGNSGAMTHAQETGQTDGEWDGRPATATPGETGVPDAIGSETFDAQEAEGVVRALRVLDRRMQREKRRAKALALPTALDTPHAGPDACGRSGETQKEEAAVAEQCHPRTEGEDGMDRQQKVHAERETGGLQEAEAVERFGGDRKDANPGAEPGGHAEAGPPQGMSACPRQADHPLRISACAVTEDLQRGIVGSSEGVLLVFDRLETSRRERQLEETESWSSELPLFPSLLASRALRGGDEQTTSNSLCGHSLFRQRLAAVQKRAVAPSSCGDSETASAPSMCFSGEPQNMFLLLGHAAEISAISSDLAGKHVASTALDGRLLVHQVPVSPLRTQRPSQSPSPSVCESRGSDGKGGCAAFDSSAASVASSRGSSRHEGTGKASRSSRNSGAGSAGPGRWGTVASSFAAAALGSSSAFPAAFVAPPPAAATPRDSLASVGTHRASLSSTSSHQATAPASRVFVDEDEGREDMQQALGGRERPTWDGSRHDPPLGPVGDAGDTRAGGGGGAASGGRSQEAGSFAEKRGGREEKSGLHVDTCLDREDQGLSNRRAEALDSQRSDPPPREHEVCIARRRRQTLNSEVFLVPPLWSVAFPQPLLSVALHPFYGDCRDAPLAGTDSRASIDRRDHRGQSLGPRSAPRLQPQRIQGGARPGESQSKVHRFASFSRFSSSARPTGSAGAVAPASPDAAEPCVSPVRQAVIWGSADGRLVLHRRGFFYSSNSLVHAGEGPVVSVSWRRSLVAWATSLGVKVLDVDMQQKVTFVPKDSPCALVDAPGTAPLGCGASASAGSRPPFESRERGDRPARRGEGRQDGGTGVTAEPCQLVWAADDVLCIAWPTLVRVVCIRSQELLDASQSPGLETDRPGQASETHEQGQGPNRRSDTAYRRLDNAQENAKNIRGVGHGDNGMAPPVVRGDPNNQASGLEAGGAHLAVGRSPVQDATGGTGKLVVKFAEVVLSLAFSWESPLCGLIVAPVSSGRVFDELGGVHLDEGGGAGACSWAVATKEETKRANGSVTGSLEGDGPSAGRGDPVGQQVGRSHSRILFAAVTRPASSPQWNGSLPRGDDEARETVEENSCRDKVSSAFLGSAPRPFQIRFVNAEGDVVRVEPLSLPVSYEGGRPAERRLEPRSGGDADRTGTETAEAAPLAGRPCRETKVTEDAGRRSVRRPGGSEEGGEVLPAETRGLERLGQTRMANAPWLEGAFLTSDASVWMLRPRNDADRGLALLSGNRRRSPRWLAEVIRVSGRVSCSFQSAVCSRVVVELLASGRSLLAASLVPLVAPRTPDPTTAWVRLVLLFHSVGALHLLLLFLPAPAPPSSPEHAFSPAVYELILTLLACCPPPHAPKPSVSGDMPAFVKREATNAEAGSLSGNAAGEDACAAAPAGPRSRCLPSSSSPDSRRAAGRRRPSSSTEAEKPSLPEERDAAHDEEKEGEVGIPSFVRKAGREERISLVLGPSATRRRTNTEAREESSAAETSRARATEYAAALCFAVQHWQLPFATALRLLNRLRCFVFGQSPVSDLAVPSFTRATVAEPDSPSDLSSSSAARGAENTSLLALLLPHFSPEPTPNSEASPAATAHSVSDSGGRAHAHAANLSDPPGSPSSGAAQPPACASENRPERRWSTARGNQAAEAIACALSFPCLGVCGGKKASARPCAACCVDVLLLEVPLPSKTADKNRFSASPALPRSLPAGAGICSPSSKTASDWKGNRKRDAFLLRAAASLAVPLLLFDVAFDALLRLRSPDVFSFLASCASRVASARAAALAKSTRRPTASTAGSGSLQYSGRSSLAGSRLGSRISCASPERGQLDASVGGCLVDDRDGRWSPTSRLAARERASSVILDERESEESLQTFPGLFTRKPCPGSSRDVVDSPGEVSGRPNSGLESGLLSTGQAAGETPAVELAEEAATMAAETALEHVPERATELLRLNAVLTLQLLMYRIRGMGEAEGGGLSRPQGKGELESDDRWATTETPVETGRRSGERRSALNGLAATPSGDNESAHGWDSGGNGLVAGKAFSEDANGCLGSVSFLFPIPAVVESLKRAQAPFWLYAYLKEVFQACPEATRNYYPLQMRLFLRFAPHLLLSFLQAADGGYDSNEALAVCRSWARHSGEGAGTPSVAPSGSSLSSLFPSLDSASPRQPPALLHCEAFLLGRLGRYSEALHLLLEDLADIPAAVALAWESANPRVWEMLVEGVVQRPCFITELLSALEDHLAAFAAYRRDKLPCWDEALGAAALRGRSESSGDGESATLCEDSALPSEAKVQNGDWGPPVSPHAAEIGSFKGTPEDVSLPKGLRSDKGRSSPGSPVASESASPGPRGNGAIREPPPPQPFDGNDRAARPDSDPTRGQVSSLFAFSAKKRRRTVEGTAAEVAARAAAAVAPLELLKRLPSHALRLVPRLERRLVVLFHQRELRDEFWEAAEKCQEDDVRELTSELFVRRRRGVAVCPRSAGFPPKDEADPVSAHRARTETRRERERQQTRRLIEAIRKRLKEYRGETDEGDADQEKNETPDPRDARAETLRRPPEADDAGDRRATASTSGDLGWGHAGSSINSYRPSQGLHASAERGSDASTGYQPVDERGQKGRLSCEGQAEEIERDTEARGDSGRSGRGERKGTESGVGEEKKNRHQSLLRSFLVLSGSSSGRSNRKQSSSRWLWGSSPRCGARGRSTEDAPSAPPLGGEGREDKDALDRQEAAVEAHAQARSDARGGGEMRATPSGCEGEQFAPAETGSATVGARETGGGFEEESKKGQWAQQEGKTEGEKVTFSHKTRRLQTLLQDWGDTSETGRQRGEDAPLFLPPSTRCVICMQIVGLSPGCRVEWRCSPSLSKGPCVPLPAVAERSPGGSACAPDRLSADRPGGPLWGSSQSGPGSGGAARLRNPAVAAVAFFCGHTAHLACCVAAQEVDPEFPHSSSTRPLVALGFRQLALAPRRVSVRGPGASPRRARSLGRTFGPRTGEGGDVAIVVPVKARDGRTRADHRPGEEMCAGRGNSLACPVCQHTPLTSWTAAWCSYGERNAVALGTGTHSRDSTKSGRGCFLEEYSGLFAQDFRGGDGENNLASSDSVGLPQHIENVVNGLW
nr:TPA: hypothetical protein BN1204_048290 [Neospora caninum Liverpool]